MKTLLLCVSALAALTLASSSPVPSSYRPQRRELVLTPRVSNVKGHDNSGLEPLGVKGHDNSAPGGHGPAALNLRKGEYLCGGRVCALQPGQVPAGCGGVCQYRLK